MINNPSISVHTIVSRMLISLSVDEILLSRHVNLSINFFRPATSSGDGKHIDYFFSVHVEVDTCCS